MVSDLMIDIGAYCRINIGLACTSRMCNLCNQENNTQPLLEVDLGYNDTFIERNYYCIDCYKYLYGKAKKFIKALPSAEEVQIENHSVFYLPAIEIKGNDPFLLYYPEDLVKWKQARSQK